MVLKKKKESQQPFFPICGDPTSPICPKEMFSSPVDPLDDEHACAARVLGERLWHVHVAEVREALRERVGVPRLVAEVELLNDPLSD